MKSSSRGFSLVEVLIAVAVALIIGYFCLRLAGSTLHAVAMTTQRFAASSTLSALEGRWLNEEDDAWAIFTPPNDVNGNSNSDGHEVDFFNRDIRHQAKFWAYTYDANAKTLTRYVYSTLGSTPTTDEVFANITSFYAHTYPLTALQDPTSEIYAPVYSSAVLQDGAVRFFASTAPWVEGGNQITYLRVQTGNGVREMHLSTWTAPSGWTVVLNYTPRPAPTSAATAAPITTWPIGISMGANGSNVASVASHLPTTVATILNGLLGGGVASAAPTCPAQAYLDSALTLLDINDSTYKKSVGIYTDGNGCIQGPSGPSAFVIATESGFKGLFNQTGCEPPFVNIGAWTPTDRGPSAALSLSGGSSRGSCTEQISDDSGQALTYGHGLVAATVTSGGACSIVGEICTFGPIPDISSPIADCQYDGSGITSQTPGWSGNPSYRISGSGSGTIIDGGSGGYSTFTRTVVGAVTISYGDVYTNWNGDGGLNNPCKAMNAWTAAGTWSFN